MSDQPATTAQPDRQSLDIDHSQPSWVWLRAAMLGALILAGILRWAEFPKPYQLPQIDELGYMSGGPTLLEGITPGYKFAPGAPVIWLGWAYAGVKSAEHLIFPGPEERAVPFQVRPFIAVNHALFDIYRDFSGLHRLIIVFNIVLSLFAVAAAFQIGSARAGLAGALLLGGVVAALPLFVEYACLGLPYSSAWSFAIIAWYFAAVYQDKRRVLLAAIFFGLSIASRIDMLALLPLMFWELWLRATPRRSRWINLLRFTIASLITAQLFAPWILTNLIGNLREIATIRFSSPPFAPPTFTHTLSEFAWAQGLGPMAIILIGGIILTYRGNRAASFLAGAYVLLLLASMFKGSGYGIRHDAAAVIALIVICGYFIPAWQQRWKWVDAILIAIAIMLPLAQCAMFIIQWKQTYVPEAATAWIEQHVPAGTRIYWAAEASLRSPLPTEASADGIWQEVNDPSGWRKKFESGLARFKLNATQIPRALSQENLSQELGNRRMWFILGGRAELPIPRYDLRVIGGSPIFGVQDLGAALQEAGGVVVWRGPLNKIPAILGDPIIQWAGPRSSGTSGVYVFATPDVKEKLTR